MLNRPTRDVELTRNVNMYNEKNREWLWMLKWKVAYFGECDKVWHNLLLVFTHKLMFTSACLARTDYRPNSYPMN